MILCLDHDRTLEYGDPCPECEHERWANFLKPPPPGPVTYAEEREQTPTTEHPKHHSYRSNPWDDNPDILN